jgi:hypothetical protein
MSRNYRYWLKPTTDQANEAIADLLNKQGDSAPSLEDQSITVGSSRVSGTYLVPHSLLTTVGHSAHKKNVRAYVQEGEGEIRPYFHFDNIGQSLSKSRPVMEALDKIARLNGGQIIYLENYKRATPVALFHY